MLATANATREPRRRRAVDERIAEALVIALAMVVLAELCQSVSEVAFAERNHAIEAFVSDRAHESLGVRVGIGRLVRRLHHSDSRIVQELAHRRAPLGVPVTDQHAVAYQEALVGGGERAAHLGA